MIFDNKKKTISSNYKTQIKDKDGNKILVDMFNYSTSTNIFFSKGNIKIFDVNNNDYSFSEIYIDENKKKIIGSDVRAFLKDDKISIDSNNDPRLFANTMKKVFSPTAKLEKMESVLPGLCSQKKLNMI